MTKFKVPDGATAASEAVGSGEATVSGAAVGPAGPTPAVDGRPASSARRGDSEDQFPPLDRLSAAAPAGPSSLEVVFADLAAAHAVLAEHSLSPLLSDGERASVIAARVRIDEVLAGLAAAAVG